MCLAETNGLYVRHFVTTREAYLSAYKEGEQIVIIAGSVINVNLKTKM